MNSAFLNLLLYLSGLNMMAPNILTETDTTALRKEENYQIPGYKTIFPKRSKENAKIRIIALIIHLSGI